MLESLKEKILSGQGICPDEALWLAEKAGLRPLLDAAQEITVQCAPRRFDLCSIINAKSGRGPFPARKMRTQLLRVPRAALRGQPAQTIRGRSD